MPQDFEKCQREGGRIRTLKLKAFMFVTIRPVKPIQAT